MAHVSMALDADDPVAGNSSACEAAGSAHAGAAHRPARPTRRRILAKREPHRAHDRPELGVISRIESILCPSAAGRTPIAQRHGSRRALGR
jgi:hypothetical protein